MTRRSAPALSAASGVAARAWSLTSAPGRRIPGTAATSRGASRLASTAWWIAARHPHWGPHVIGALRKSLAGTMPSAAVQTALVERLLRSVPDSDLVLLRFGEAGDAIHLPCVRSHHVL